MVGGGLRLQRIIPELSTPVICNNMEDTIKFNPINIMRTGEEMAMLECKQF